ncbi:SWF or SNF family helicase [Streptomyces sp. RFCAC02]|uniref:SWF or SNF family helicase n=1 Tax=Streptomyces sp. RFCAC02 TaxID=2499143 RepID=UPI00101F6171
MDSDDIGGHDDAERVLAALPPAPGRGFAATWWGRGWLKALEDTALDNAGLARGRRLARAGAVGAVSLRPGRLTAVVRDADGVRYRADVLLRVLTGAEWDRLLDTAAREAGHLAALLDHEMPRHLAADAAAAGVDLLPVIGDLEPACECGEWAHCAHTAALAYQVARLLDTDPFLLLLLRGRQERRLIDALQRRAALHAPAPARTPPRPDPYPPVPADEAYARAADLPPLPEPPGTVTGPVEVPDLGPEPVRPPDEPDGDTTAVPGLRALEFLIADTAVRARRLLAESLRPGHAATSPPASLTLWQDAVRMAAGRPPEPVAARLAEHSGRPRAEFEAAVAAWPLSGTGSGAAQEDGT